MVQRLDQAGLSAPCCLRLRTLVLWSFAQTWSSAWTQPVSVLLVVFGLEPLFSGPLVLLVLRWNMVQRWVYVSTFSP